MTADPQSRGLSATKRVFTRPANLHLAWSSSKGIGSPFRRVSASSSTISPLPTSESLIKAARRQPPTHLAPITQIGSPLASHPYSSFASRSDDDWNPDPFDRPLSPAIEHRSPAKYKQTLPTRVFDSSGSVLRSGHLTWKNAGEYTSPTSASNGFEKALRRRQAVRERAVDKDPTVFVTLEQTDLSAMDITSRSHRHDISTSSLRTFLSEPYLASPGACDPSAFDIDGLPSLIPPPVPNCLGDQSRWVPPTSWDTFRAASNSQDSQSKSSSSSSVSDSLQTPRSSQPGSPKEQEIYLNVYSQGVTTSCSLMKLCITRDSTVKLQAGLCQTGAMEDSPQLTVTGELVNTIRSQGLHTDPSTYDRARSSSSSREAVCILSSPNIAKLREWLYTIQDAIKRCRDDICDQAATRRSSASMLDTIRLMEQLKVHRRSEQHTQDQAWHNKLEDQQATPMTASRSLPVVSHKQVSAACGSIRFVGSDLDFSPSTFIDYYSADTDSAFTASTSSALYDIEDAWASIMQRFSDCELPSPMEGLPSAPLDGVVAHARSECLDMPVSPCNTDFDQDYSEEQEDRPGSPLDPWLFQRSRPSVTSLEMRELDAYADDAVRMIFAEGFRRRSSTVS